MYYVLKIKLSFIFIYVYKQCILINKYEIYQGKKIK